MWAIRGLCVLCNISVIGLRATPTQLDEYTVGHTHKNANQFSSNKGTVSISTV